MIRVSELNQASTRRKKTVVPALEAQSGNGRHRRFVGGWFERLLSVCAQIEQHELAWVKAESVIGESLAEITSERNQLRLDSFGARNPAKGLHQIVQELPSESELFVAG